MGSRVGAEEGAACWDHKLQPKFPRSLQCCWEGAQPVHVTGGYVPWRGARRWRDVCEETPLPGGRWGLEVGQGVGESRGPAWLHTCFGVMGHVGWYQQGKWWAGRWKEWEHSSSCSHELASSHCGFQ